MLSPLSLCCLLDKEFYGVQKLAFQYFTFVQNKVFELWLFLLVDQYSHPQGREDTMSSFAFRQQSVLSSFAFRQQSAIWSMDHISSVLKKKALVSCMFQVQFRVLGLSLKPLYGYGIPYYIGITAFHILPVSLQYIPLIHTFTFLMQVKQRLQSLSSW